MKNKGFTFVEILVSLVLFVTLFSIVASTLHVVFAKTSKEANVDLSVLNLERFYWDAYFLIKDSYSVSVTSNSISGYRFEGNVQKNYSFTFSNTGILFQNSDNLNYFYKSNLQNYTLSKNDNYISLSLRFNIFYFNFIDISYIFPLQNL